MIAMVNIFQFSIFADAKTGIFLLNPRKKDIPPEIRPGKKSLSLRIDKRSATSAIVNDSLAYMPSSFS